MFALDASKYRLRWVRIWEYERGRLSPGALFDRLRFCYPANGGSSQAILIWKSYTLKYTIRCTQVLKQICIAPQR